LVECVTALIAVWKSYDWKSRLDWKAARRSLIAKTAQLLSKWAELAARLNYQSSFKEKHFALNALLAEQDG
jgi:hypothetical protein